jgi:hypothetical protein
MLMLIKPSSRKDGAAMVMNESYSLVLRTVRLTVAMAITGMLEFTVTIIYYCWNSMQLSLST